MMLNTKCFEVDEYLNLAPLGDIHFGSRECDVDKFKEAVKWIRDRNNTAVILMGDMINCGTTVSPGAGVFDDQYNPQEQYELMTELLRPIKDQVIGYHNGNHEDRIRELSSFDVAKLMSRELHCPYLGYGAMHKIRVNDMNYHIYSVHGSSGAASLIGKMAACLKMKENADADIYLYGHTHGLDHIPQEYYSVCNRGSVIKRKTRHFVLTGNFVRWDGSYGEKKNYPLLKLGMPRIRLYGNEDKVTVKLNVKD